MSTDLANFWRSYVHIGVLTYSLGASAVMVYAVAAPVPHRSALVILGCLSLGASIGPFRWLGSRLVTTRWSSTFFSAWVACTFAFVAVGAVLDGGVRSSVAFFLVLPLLYGGLALSVGRVSLLAAIGVVTAFVVGLATPHPDWSACAFLAFAMAIAGVLTATAAFNRDRLVGQLMDAANFDALTGCLSRGAFQERLAEESRHAGRSGTPFSLIVADVDNLKSLNDARGHPSGDRALRLLASVLSASARESDVVGRLGGDEFAMLLHDTGQEGALTAATRLTEALRKVTGSDAVTASLGVSTWQGSDDSPDALLSRADEALYVAKRAGRDQAALWVPPASTTPVSARSGPAET